MSSSCAWEMWINLYKPILYLAFQKHAYDERIAVAVVDCKVF